ncbi:Glycogenin-2 [Gonapodya sp. JEL0774]|nr:Glycogenin-2 [Gonapodya sp. JEL0774]
MRTPSQNQRAFVTLITSDSYVTPACVLADALRRLHPATPTSPAPDIAILVSAGSLQPVSLSVIARFFDRIIHVDPILTRSSDLWRLEGLLERPDLREALTKLHVFDPEVTGRWDTIVYLDADVIPQRSVIDLFDVLGVPGCPDRAVFAAVADTGWPDIFNSGVFVTRPERTVFNGIVETAAREGSFDGADQGVLNSFFSSWAASGASFGSDAMRSVRLPFVYNVTPSATYTYAPAFNKFKNDIRILHYAGESKPWNLKRSAAGDVQIDKGQMSNVSYETFRDIQQRWWSAYDSVDWNRWETAEVSRVAQPSGPCENPPEPLSRTDIPPPYYAPVDVQPPSEPMLNLPPPEKPMLARSPPPNFPKNTPGAAIPRKLFQPAEPWMAVGDCRDPRIEKKPPIQPPVSQPRLTLPPMRAAKKRPWEPPFEVSGPPPVIEVDPEPKAETPVDLPDVPDEVPQIPRAITPDTPVISPVEPAPPPVEEVPEPEDEMPVEMPDLPEEVPQVPRATTPERPATPPVEPAPPPVEEVPEPEDEMPVEMPDLPEEVPQVPRAITPERPMPDIPEEVPQIPRAITPERPVTPPVEPAPPPIEEVPEPEEEVPVEMPDIPEEVPQIPRAITPERPVTPPVEPAPPPIEEVPEPEEEVPVEMPDVPEEVPQIPRAITPDRPVTPPVDPAPPPIEEVPEQKEEAPVEMPDLPEEVPQVPRAITPERPVTPPVEPAPPPVEEVLEPEEELPVMMPDIPIETPQIPRSVTPAQPVIEIVKAEPPAVARAIEPELLELEEFEVEEELEFDEEEEFSYDVEEVEVQELEEEAIEELEVEEMDEIEVEELEVIETETKEINVQVTREVKVEAMEEIEVQEIVDEEERSLEIQEINEVEFEVVEEVRELEVTEEEAEEIEEVSERSLEEPSLGSQTKTEVSRVVHRIMKAESPTEEELVEEDELEDATTVTVRVLRVSERAAGQVLKDELVQDQVQRTTTELVSGSAVQWIVLSGNSEVQSEQDHSNFEAKLGEQVAYALPAESVERGRTIRPSASVLSLTELASELPKSIDDPILRSREAYFSPASQNTPQTGEMEAAARNYEEATAWTARKFELDQVGRTELFAEEEVTEEGEPAATEEEIVEEEEPEVITTTVVRRVIRRSIRTGTTVEGAVGEFEAHSNGSERTSPFVHATGVESEENGSSRTTRTAELRVVRNIPADPMVFPASSGEADTWDLPWEQSEETTISDKATVEARHHIMTSSTSSIHIRKSDVLVVESSQGQEGVQQSRPPPLTSGEFENVDRLGLEARAIKTLESEIILTEERFTVDSHTQTRNGERIYSPGLPTMDSGRETSRVTIQQLDPLTKRTTLLEKESNRGLSTTMLTTVPSTQEESNSLIVQLQTRNAELQTQRDSLQKEVGREISKIEELEKACAKVAELRASNALLEQHLNDQERILAELVLQLESEPAEPLIYVAVSFEPVLDDELKLRAGDTVSPRVEYSDGWGWGLNVTTARFGFFPLLCFEDVSPESTQGELLTYPERSTSRRL